jgi:hypothetical protein
MNASRRIVKRDSRARLKIESLERRDLVAASLVGSLISSLKSPMVMSQAVLKTVNTPSAAILDAQGFQATPTVKTTAGFSASTPTPGAHDSTLTKPPSSGLSSSGVDGYFSSMSGSKSSPRTLAGALVHDHAGDDWLRLFCLELWCGVN